MIRIVLVLLVATLPLASCSTSGDGAGSADAKIDAPAATDMTAEAVNNVVRDARVVLYQPQTGAAMILVNARHVGRDTLEGRRALALGLPNQGYKVLSDLQMDALLESLEAAGAASIAEPGSPADYQMIGQRGDQARLFKGLIVVENDGRMVRYVGRPARGDMALAERLQTFVNLKGLVARWEQANSLLELPDNVMQGRGADPFHVPAATRTPDDGR